jgi:hypothetical protein
VSSPPERRERHFRIDLRTGRILDDTPEPPVEEIPEDEWRPLGTIDQTGGPRRLLASPPLASVVGVLAMVSSA